MKLISMTDFVLEQAKKDLSAETTANNCISYAQFLKQPLKLEMFVTCDDEGNILEEPNINEHKTSPFCETGDCQAYRHELQDFEISKRKILFKNIIYLCYNPVDKSYELFDTKANHIFWMENYGTIEDYVDYNLKLTESAIKQIGL